MEFGDKIMDKGGRFRGSYEWVSPIPTKQIRRTLWLQVLKKNWRNYCESSSLVGYRYLVEPHRPWIER